MYELHVTAANLSYWKHQKLVRLAVQYSA